jgi:hypothetical protein
VAGSYEHGNETSGSIKAGNFFDQLSDCCLIKKVTSYKLQVTECSKTGYTETNVERRDRGLF